MVQDVRAQHGATGRIWLVALLLLLPVFVRPAASDPLRTVGGEVRELLDTESLPLGPPAPAWLTRAVQVDRPTSLRFQHGGAFGAAFHKDYVINWSEDGEPVGDVAAARQSFHALVPLSFEDEGRQDAVLGVLLDDYHVRGVYAPRGSELHLNNDQTCRAVAIGWWAGSRTFLGAAYTSLRADVVLDATDLPLLAPPGGRLPRLRSPRAKHRWILSAVQQLPNAEMELTYSGLISDILAIGDTTSGPARGGVRLRGDCLDAAYCRRDQPDLTWGIYGGMMRSRGARGLRVGRLPFGNMRGRNVAWRLGMGLRRDGAGMNTFAWVTLRRAAGEYDAELFDVPAPFASFFGQRTRFDAATGLSALEFGWQQQRKLTPRWKLAYGLDGIVGSLDSHWTEYQKSSPLSPEHLVADTVDRRYLHLYSVAIGGEYSTEDYSVSLQASQAFGTVKRRRPPAPPPPVPRPVTRTRGGLLYSLTVRHFF